MCLFSAGAKRTVTLTGRATVVAAAKRDADKPADDDCVIYRYGSFCTGIEVFGELPSVRAACVAREPLETVVGDRPPIFVFFSEGIEKVEIVQMDNAVMATPDKNKNVLDITVTCQGR